MLFCNVFYSSLTYSPSFRVSLAGVNQAPCSTTLHPLQSDTLALSKRLDCLHALGDKALYVMPIIRGSGMHRPPSIFLDTNALKASVDTRIVLLPQSQKNKRGDREFDVDVHRPVFVNQNTKYLARGNRERYGRHRCASLHCGLGERGKDQASHASGSPVRVNAPTFSHWTIH